MRAFVVRHVRAPTELRPIVRANRAVLHGRGTLQKPYLGLIASLSAVAVLIGGAVMGDASLQDDVGWRGVLAIVLMLVICWLPFRFGLSVWKLSHLDRHGRIIVGRVIDTETHVDRNGDGPEIVSCYITYEFVTPQGERCTNTEKLVLDDGVRRPLWNEEVAVKYADGVSALL
jgi:hypothetical protein